MKDKQIDKLLNIHTIGNIKTYASSHHNAYEPTDYEVLDELINSNYIHSDNVVVDYGCGKGRVDFYLRYQLGCKCIGVEYDPHIIQYAYDNLQSSKLDQIEFIQQDASEYIVPLNADRFYFFNPFSLPILRRTIQKILDSYELSPREIYLFFYYPTDEYIHYLLNEIDLDYVDEISTQHIYHNASKYECIFIFKVSK